MHSVNDTIKMLCHKVLFLENEIQDIKNNKNMKNSIRARDQMLTAQQHDNSNQS
jgi:hypothetical protein